MKIVVAHFGTLKCCARPTKAKKLSYPGATHHAQQQPKKRFQAERFGSLLRSLGRSQ
jgi:hypothetical protein